MSAHEILDLFIHIILSPVFFFSCVNDIVHIVRVEAISVLMTAFNVNGSCQCWQVDIPVVKGAVLHEIELIGYIVTLRVNLSILGKKLFAQSKILEVRRVLSFTESCHRAVLCESVVDDLQFTHAKHCKCTSLHSCIIS